MTITVDLPDQTLRGLDVDLDRVTGEVRLALAISWYTEGRISQGRAAEVAGIPRADMIDELARRQIPVTNITPEDLQREIDAIEKRLG